MQHDWFARQHNVHGTRHCQHPDCVSMWLLTIAPPLTDADDPHNDLHAWLVDAGEAAREAMTVSAARADYLRRTNLPIGSYDHGYDDQAAEVLPSWERHPGA